MFTQCKSKVCQIWFTVWIKEAVAAKRERHHFCPAHQALSQVVKADLNATNVHWAHIIQKLAPLWLILATYTIDLDNVCGCRRFLNRTSVVDVYQLMVLKVLQCKSKPYPSCCQSFLNACQSLRTQSSVKNLYSTSLHGERKKRFKLNMGKGLDIKAEDDTITNVR